MATAPLTAPQPPSSHPLSTIAQSPAKPRRPSPKTVHARPLPLQIHPLPALIPHNPLSVLRILYVLVTQTLVPPCSHPQPASSLGVSTKSEAGVTYQRGGGGGGKRYGTYTAYYDAATRSVHVTDETAIRALWEQGFFGKGNLSRSEPEWVEREERRREMLREEKAQEAEEASLLWSPLDSEDIIAAPLNGSLFSEKGKRDKLTSSEVTNRRREERKEEKRQRAKREAEAVEEQLRAEGHLIPKTDETLKELKGENTTLLSKKEPAIRRVKAMNGHTKPNGVISVGPRPKIVRFDSKPKTIYIPRHAESTTAIVTTPKIPQNAALLHRVLLPPSTHPPSVPDPDLLISQEHLQLNPTEAFFLTYGLGILTIVDAITSKPLSVSELLTLFRRTSYFPPLPAQTPPLTQPDDPFLLSYVVYHHFRSLGWVVRPGVKFAVDMLLYNRGPVFSHAEFAVLILPSYSHPYWRQDAARRKRVQSKERKDWWWLHCANRVQAQVRKSLVLAYVDVPPDNTAATATADGKVTQDQNKMDVGALLRGYKVREFVIGRWSMNRNRD